MSPKRNQTTIAGLVFIGLIMAGCAGGGSAPEGVDTPSGPVATGEPTGTIAGQVLTEDSLPVANADVGLLPIDVARKTDESGSFEIEGVPAGTYALVVQKLGYESFSRSVTVAEDEVQTLDVTLVALAVKDPHYKTEEMSGRLACSYYTPIPLAVPDPVNGGFIFHPWTTCHEPIRQQFGEHVHCLDFTVAESTTWRMAELAWTQTSDLAPENLWLGERNPDREEGGWGEFAEGAAPVVVTTDIEYDFDDEEAEEPPKSTWCVFISSLSWPAPSVAIEQDFTVYYTAFYDMDEIPDGYSGRPSE